MNCWGDSLPLSGLEIPRSHTPKAVFLRPMTGSSRRITIRPEAPNARKLVRSELPSSSGERPRYGPRPVLLAILPTSSCRVLRGEDYSSSDEEDSSEAERRLRREEHPALRQRNLDESQTYWAPVDHPLPSGPSSTSIRFHCPRLRFYSEANSLPVWHPPLG